MKAVIDDVRGIDIEQDEKDVDAYLTALKKATNEASRQDIFSKASLYQESLYVIKDLSTLISLIDAVDLLANNTEYRPIIQHHIDLSALADLSIELKKQYIKKEILDSGGQKFHTYAGNPSSSELIDLEGNRISKRQVLLDCLEAGEDAYMDRRNSYEIFGN